MKKIILSTLFVCIFAATVAFGQSSLNVDYQKFEDITTVSGKKASLIDDVTDVSFTPMAAFSGQVPKDFSSIKFFLNFSCVRVADEVSEQRAKFEGNTLILLVDNKDRVSGSLKFYKEIPKATYSQGTPYYITSHYVFSLPVDFDQLKKISEAKKIEMQWKGQPQDYTFTSEAIASAKEMVTYFEKFKAISPK